MSSILGILIYSYIVSFTSIPDGYEHKINPITNRNIFKYLLLKEFINLSQLLLESLNIIPKINAK